MTRKKEVEDDKEKEVEDDKEKEVEDDRGADCHSRPLFFVIPAKAGIQRYRCILLINSIGDINPPRWDWILLLILVSKHVAISLSIFPAQALAARPHILQHKRDGIDDIFS
jgi:hypothetical protein